MAKTANAFGSKVYLKNEPTIDKIEEVAIPPGLTSFADKLGDAVDHLSYESPSKGASRKKRKLRGAHRVEL